MDPTNTDNLIDKIASGAYAWLAETTQASEKALSLTESGEHDEAWHWWYRVFGDPFPEPPETPDGLQAAMTGLYVGQGAPTPTRAWKRRT